MKTLIISTEGQSEDAFVKAALQPYLQNFGLHAKSIILGTGRGRNGGWVKFGDLEKEIREVLHSPANRNAFITTMYDFADIKEGFPDYQKIISEPNKYLAIAHAESVLSGNFSQSKFIAYFQMHQFETLVFSQPDVLLQEFPGSEKAIAELKWQCSNYKDENPELINSANKPSYRIANTLAVKTGTLKGALLEI